MQFTKKNNIYQISRITGSQDNILGVYFSENNSNDVEVIEWDLSFAKDKKRQTSADLVLDQVLSGLNQANEFLATSYKLSKIYFVPAESADGFIYRSLVIQLIKHYHEGKEFK